MQIKVDRVSTPNDVRNDFDKVVSQWFKEFGEKITDDHYLRVNPVKIFCSKWCTRYERTADLVLTAPDTAADKVLVSGAVQFVGEREN